LSQLHGKWFQQSRPTTERRSAGYGLAKVREEESMAKDHGPSVKDDEQYEKLREKGESKQKAARIANTGRSKSGKRGGKSGSYEDWSKKELQERAKEIGIEGRSTMNKDELIDALRNH
jgi:Rho termination factor, N-terminal domain